MRLFLFALLWGAVSAEWGRFAKRSLVDVILNITIVSPEHPKYGQSLYAIPALFGPSALSRRTLPVFRIKEKQTCQPYTVEKPLLNGTEYKEWIGLIPRGGCAFDVKVLQGQMAGLSAVGIYNDGVTSGIYKPGQYRGEVTDVKVDIPIRMSASGVAQYIQIPSFFLTHAQTKVLFGYDEVLDIYQQTPDAFLVSVEPVSWDVFQENESRFDSVLSKILFFVSLGMLSASILMSLGIIIGLIRNYFMHGTPFYDNRRRSLPKLDRVDFPLTVFKEGDNIDGKCCAICIDDFAVGSKARRLPCGHEFHDECVDPWLMRHHRLCPVCKRDVLEMQQQVPKPHWTDVFKRWMGYNRVSST